MFYAKPMPAYLRKNLFKRFELYPVRMNLQEDTMLFLPVDPKTFADEPFHDYRLMNSASEGYITSISQLIKRYRKLIDRDKSLKLICHTAFCGSTLLSKSLGLSHQAFVYREPNLVSELALWKRAEGEGHNQKYYNDVIKLTLALLCRTPDGETPVMKLNDNCNELAKDLLSKNPKSSALIMYSNLEDFLISTLKNTDRRTFVHSRLKELSGFSVPGFENLDTTELTDPKSIALLWIKQIVIAADMITEQGDQVVSLLGDDLFEDLPSSTEALAQHMVLKPRKNLSVEGLTELVSTHAKTGQQFDAAEHLEKQNQLKDQYRSDIDEALQWASPILSDLSLGGRLNSALKK